MKKMNFFTVSNPCCLIIQDKTQNIKKIEDRLHRIIYGFNMMSDSDLSYDEIFIVKKNSKRLLKQLERNFHIGYSLDPYEKAYAIIFCNLNGLSDETFIFSYIIEKEFNAKKIYLG